MGDEAIEADLPYRAEYAKSGRSSCKSCKTSIAEVRIHHINVACLLTSYLPITTVNIM